jgi:CheY-like chemotaxis protein
MVDVLVVDDEPGVQEFAQMTLRQANVNCRTTASAKGALQLAARAGNRDLPWSYSAGTLPASWRPEPAAAEHAPLSANR